MVIAYIGLGSNLGFAGLSTIATLLAAMDFLEPLCGRSSMYQTEPIGYSAQPAFINAVVALHSDLAPAALLGHLLNVEGRFGRDRSSGIRNGPRTLDLDLLLFGDMVLRQEYLTVPHPRLAERRFVLAPLVEIAPGLQHPVLRRTMRQLLEDLPGEGENRPDAVRRLPAQK